MKYSAIKDMFYGNRGQHDNVIINKNDLKILDSVIKFDDTLRDKLKTSPEILEIYNEFDNAVSELNSIENEHYYIEGFKFGFLMAMDIYNLS